MKLIIVESPAKCDTIKRYLGEDYTIMASLGHIRDLATSGKGGLGVDVENDFKPTYSISSSKIKVVKSLQQAAKKAKEVILATDPDREGEAIAWHLAQVLGLDVNTTKRLEFHEITRDSITNAIERPRTINLNLVSSQETRRIIDRIIGFKLSSLLNKKIHSRSAGRVQSATLKIIADHEKEILSFVPQEYYKFNIKSSFNNIEYSLNLKLDETISNGHSAQQIIDSIPEKLEVIDVKKEIKIKESKEPFTTSTLQQAAFNKFKYKTKKTQFIAQTLYEGLSIGDEHVGLITYMRTDSTRLSPTYVKRAANFIIETFGKEYIGNIKKGRGVQDAHEAIRPTGNHRTPEYLKPYLTKDQYNLYKLIYNRALASLMANKKEEVTTITLKGGDYIFTLEGTRVVFNGFEILYKDDNEKTNILPLINIGDNFDVTFKEAEQKFTMPPTRYSEAKIVKIMEEVGIGRPSTYASTISILQTRKYITDVSGVLQITDQGQKTAHVLEKYFPDIVNTEYTAQMELKLDNVQAGEQSYKKILNDFYYPFIKEVDDANVRMYKDEAEPTGELCPKCGSPLVYKQGKNGKFIGCSNYPSCRYVKKEPKKDLVYTGEVCPVCGKPLVERKDKKNRTFIACSGFPTCHYIKTTKQDVIQNNEPQVEIKDRVCPKCGGKLIIKKGKYSNFIGCSNFPKCRYMEKIENKNKG